MTPRRQQQVGLAAGVTAGVTAGVIAASIDDSSSKSI
eukprot:CAMPEP_0119029956 /NCGR_PEP_ID=MMETSP1176-20130426/40785_1 /TAXON_ID=265551 /ORGANISM="Synedropsis recta cf, Strain CCMP1620" /LENGTH=36 /DNA_ID= /DNA_START= /DNA_END= /DNA_ORIENTATION=